MRVDALYSLSKFHRIMLQLRLVHLFSRHTCTS